MPTIISHAAVPLAIGLGLGVQAIGPRLLWTGVAASMLPDADVLGLRLGIAYGDSLGHRGATHSLAFATLLGLVAWACARPLATRRLTAFLFIAFSAASHGLLDMLTDGGSGVALWWPWSDERLFAPWRFIEASPLSLRRLLGGRGIEVLRSELIGVWMPAIVAGVTLWLTRRGARTR